MKFSTNKLFRFMFSILLIAVPISIIFYFSSQPGAQSYDISHKFSITIAQKWNGLFSLNLSSGDFNTLVTSLYMPTRKLAHIIEYGALGVFVFVALYLIQKKVKLSGILLSMAFIVLIAFCDEIHQAYVLQRGSHLTDVCIDVVSGFLGMYAFIIMKDLFRRIVKIFKALGRK